MKLLFICGSLEPGRDGVGDYTRRLAGELIRQGHECRVVAMNERHLVPGDGGGHALEQDGIQVLRLSGTLPWRKRTRLVRKWTEAFAPDWASLQFVPYSFQMKGLPVGLGSRLRQVAPGARWHVMFHELWIGMEEAAPLRQRLVGALQRQLIRRLIGRLAPEKISTQTQLYIAQLENLGFEATRMPLFGNIPKQSVAAAPPDTSESSFHLVLFGGIHQKAPIVEFARECARFGTAVGKTVRLTIAGRSGTEQEKWKEAWLNEGLRVEATGECSPDELSMLFQSASFGIATTPVALIEKSGAAAAMLEHSLPIINVAARWIPRRWQGGDLPNGIFEYRASKLSEAFSAGEQAFVSGFNVQAVALQLGDLLKHSR